jgi:hypothetical protein
MKQILLLYRMGATLTIVLDAPTGLPYWACLQVDDKGPIWMQKAS